MTLEKIFPPTSIPERSNETISLSFQEHPLQLINKSFSGEEGYIIAFPPDLESELIEALKNASQQDIEVIDAETWETLRIEAGIPLFNKDMSEKNVLPETGLEHTSVSYNKGCYIGQEVIARIKTYGAPNFSLMGLVVEGDALPPYNGEFMMNDKKIGIVKSSCHSPSLDKNIALVYMQKDHRSPNIKISGTINGEAIEATTSLLPFYQLKTRTAHSQDLLNKALEIYKTEDNLDRPIQLLREAIDLDPKHAAAYEALGVFLSKQNKLDEAIALMKRLAEIDPQEIMAHTNLSIYYMQQGRIEDAEMEKGEATALQFEKLIAEKQLEKSKVTQAEKSREEQERKIAMFTEVLGIDPVDPVANFGLASIYHETQKYEDALPLLETVIKEKKDYSAAYLLMGKTLEKLSRLEQASDIFRQGIAVASKKGDLMPLNDMQTRLNTITSSKPNSI